MKSALEHDHRQRKGGARQALAVSAVASAERERLVSEVIANEAAQAASVIWCRHGASLQVGPPPTGWVRDHLQTLYRRNVDRKTESPVPRTPPGSACTIACACPIVPVRRGVGGQLGEPP